MLPLIERQPRHTWLERMRSLDRAHPSIDVLASEVVTPQYVLRELNKIVEHSADPVVVTGVGQHQMWTAQFMFMPTRNRFVSSGGLGVMGFETPAAIGAQNGRPGAGGGCNQGDGGGHGQYNQAAFSAPVWRWGARRMQNICLLFHHHGLCFRPRD